MDVNNPVVALCATGMRAEVDGDPVRARELFRQAWDVATDDYEACVAAHYLARHQDSPEETLRWDEECLARADKVGDDRVTGFYPSLHLRIAKARLDLGDRETALTHYRAAAGIADTLPADPYGTGIRFAVAEGLRSVDAHPREVPRVLEELLDRLCDKRELKALGLILPAFLGDLGTDEDKLTLVTSLTMLHAGRTLPDQEQLLIESLVKALSTN